MAQLSELHKKTLASYIKKASNEVGMGAYSAGLNTDVSRAGRGKPEHPGFKQAKKRIKGIEKAANKLAKEEVDLTEAKHGPEKLNADLRRHNSLMRNNPTEAEKHYEQMSREHGEEYAAHVRNAVVNQHKPNGWIHVAKASKILMPGRSKRHTGIAKAADKLTKEEVQVEGTEETSDAPVHYDYNSWKEAAKKLGAVSFKKEGSHEAANHKDGQAVGHWDHIENSGHTYHSVHEETEVENMTRFVDLASGKQASEFQTQLETVMQQKVGAALDARKEVIASKIFGEGEVASESVVKVKGGYENVGKTGKRHGVFKTKAGAEKQKAAMFANGFKG